MTRPCLLVLEDLYDNGHQWNCQIASEDMFGAEGILLPIRGGISFAAKDNRITSGKTFLKTRGAIIDGLTALDLSGARFSFFSSAALSDRFTGGQSTMVQTTGTRTVLALLIKGEGSDYSTTIEDLEDNVFEDSVSLKTQYEACSYGELQIDPFTGTLGDMTIEGGVGTVELSGSITGVNYVLVEAQVMLAASIAFGPTWLLRYNHLMLFHSPAVDLPAIASASLPGRLSRYRSGWTASNTVMVRQHDQTAPWLTILVASHCSSV